MDGLLNTLKFVHKMWLLFLWWFISRRWLPKHKLDVSLIWTVVKFYKNYNNRILLTSSTWCYRWIL